MSDKSKTKTKPITIKKTNKHDTASCSPENSKIHFTTPTDAYLHVPLSYIKELKNLKHYMNTSKNYEYK
jgi:hypothetical protein